MSPIATATDTIASPFARAKEKARERDIKKQQLVQEAEAVKAAELQAKRQAAKQAYLTQDVERFIEAFATAAAKRGDEREWKEAALNLAERYVVALTSHEDVELPKIDASMAGVINDAFAYGVSLYYKRPQRDNIPSDYFVGQRQEWFAELFAKKNAGH